MRRAIAGTARRLFAERGFESVTVAEIAAVADVSAKTVFNHFPVKEQIFFETDPLGWPAPERALRERVTGERPVDAIRRVMSRPATDAGEGVADAGAVAVHARVYRDSPALRSYSREMFAEQERALREAIESGAGTEEPGAGRGLGAGVVAALILAAVREVWESTLLRIAAGAAFEDAATLGRRELDAALDLLSRDRPDRDSPDRDRPDHDRPDHGSPDRDPSDHAPPDLARGGSRRVPPGEAARLPANEAGGPDRGADRPARGADGRAPAGGGEAGAGGRDVPAPIRGDRPSITRVAQLAGVSATTVSHALNGRRPVAEETRRRVLAAIDQLGYRPNVLARGLRTSRSQTIGLIIPDITNPFYPALARGLQDVLGPAGYDEIISNTDGDREMERAAIEQMIARQVDGLAFAVFHTHAEDLLPVIGAGIPVVRLGGRLVQAGVDVVHSDDEGGAAEATRYLLERGYRRIGFVCGPHAEGPAAERVAGYRSALLAAGADADPRLVAHTHFSRAGGSSGTARLLDLPDPPDAVLCANDIMAIGALDRAGERGLRVPADLAVMGFDDIEAASLVSPGLTTMANPAREIGQACARRLLERLRGGTAESSAETVIPARLVRRRSA
ncbi:substrate-binding domain-containing protein [Streptosporangium sp. NBC_01495]|uniref:substrate-binding domain-containing protein n=1 Tax=Streptosporangium sp. NBC_01495 TaxID=2903899 RepID=UPI002E33347F|nr:substrate-binding domain-containing protein [Streptosporangium sp. NBC_01495]